MMTNAQERYNKADQDYQAWKRENPGVDALNGNNPDGQRLSIARDKALDDLTAEQRRE